MATLHPLKTFRRERNLSQQGLADFLGVTRKTVLLWEKGTRKPGRKYLPTITEKTGIPPRDLRPDLIELLGEVAA